MTDGVTFQGMWTMPTATVAVSVAGLDCGNFVVNADGTVFVPFGSDSGGQFTANYLNAVSNSLSTDPALMAISITDGDGDTIIVYVPVTIGYPFTSQGLTTRPMIENQIKSAEGSGLAKKRRLQEFGMLLENAQGLSVGGDFQHLELQVFTANNVDDSPISLGARFTGVYWQKLNGNWDFDGQIAWQITRPYPCTVSAVSGFIETDER